VPITVRRRERQRSASAPRRPMGRITIPGVGTIPIRPAIESDEQGDIYQFTTLDLNRVRVGALRVWCPDSSRSVLES